MVKRNNKIIIDFFDITFQDQIFKSEKLKNFQVSKNSEVVFLDNLNWTTYLRKFFQRCST